MDIKQKIEQSYNKIKPDLIKTINSGMQGYIFGCMVGIFSKESKDIRSFAKNVNDSGILFAKVGMVYAGTECILERVRNKKCMVNGIIAGSITGSLLTKKSKVMSGVGFGLYSGMVEYYNKE